MWWDDSRHRYRTSLPHKIFYRWGWPAVRLVMFRCMSSERAHLVALHHGIPLVGRIDRAWTTVKVLGVLILILPLIILARLPGFQWEPDE